MRDIGTRIQRYRLSRYAPPGSRRSHGLFWFWLAAALWLIWAAFVSEHNFVRLGQLDRERARSANELKRIQGQVAVLDARLRNPAAQRDLTEHALREKAGMARPGELIYQIPAVTPSRR
jgi:cell division protein FtsB